MWYEDRLGPLHVGVPGNHQILVADRQTDQGNLDKEKGVTLLLL